MENKPTTLYQLEACPFCGHDEVFTKDWVEGPAITRMGFDFDPSNHDNSEMYDGLQHYSGDRVYCRDCGKFIGTLSNGRLSVSAIKQISKNLNDAE